MNTSRNNIPDIQMPKRQEAIRGALLRRITREQNAWGFEHGGLYFITRHALTFSTAIALIVLVVLVPGMNIPDARAQALLDAATGFPEGQAILVDGVPVYDLIEKAKRANARVVGEERIALREEVSADVGTFSASFIEDTVSGDIATLSVEEPSMMAMRALPTEGEELVLDATQTKVGETEEVLEYGNGAPYETGIVEEKENIKNKVEQKEDKKEKKDIVSVVSFKDKGVRYDMGIREGGEVVFVRIRE